ncbi:conserved hypothetical protein [Paraglaciecola sp. T6c]|uniref:Ig-like domain-containing protein n=1 Tax=Pseudoalteromonas atlantica (strain T6c / ATCC BAA-1087) TaxID=3042615 RepID=UPI00005C7605|nr:Ig-like domain-containing protein [Paraglaciecola sp. T6c]ABG41171.1 conserved hypothetical protein [Paraglaciecola sp. T6c]
MADIEYIVERIDGDDSITVIDEKGDIRFVSEGEIVSIGDTILSFDGGQVVLRANGQSIVLDNSIDVFIGTDLAPEQNIQSDEESQIDIDEDFLALLDGDGDLLDSLESTAAGSDSGGESGDGSTFVRVDRISEEIDPIEFEYNQAVIETTELDTQGVLAADFDIEFDLPDEINDATPTFTGTTSAPEGTLVQVVVTDQNGNAQNLTSVVQDDGTFTVNVDGTLSEGTFTVDASITDDQGNTTTVSVNSAVDVTPPIIDNIAISDDSNTPTVSGQTDTLPGTQVTITVTDANGNIEVINAIVQDNGSFNGTLVTPLTEGDFAVVTEVTDSAGNTTSVTSTGNVDTAAPSVTDTTNPSSNSDTPLLTGTSNAEPGSEVIITVTDANGDSQVINAVVQEDGTYSGSPANALAEGEFTLVTQITDQAGNTTSVTSTGSVDTTAPSVTDTTNPSSNSDTPLLTGTSNAEPGSEVTITVTDANGDSQVINAVVQADGTYSGSPANALAEGEFTLVTQITDQAGNTTSVTSTGSVDTTAPSVTDTTNPSSNSDTPLLTGTSNAEPGSEVTITVTDANGDSQVINAVVQEDGTYSGSPANALAEGEFTLVTQITDQAGNTTSVTSTGNIDTTAPVLTVDAPDNSNDATPTLTGTTDVPASSIVELTVTGSDGAVQILSATVQANGTYSVDVPNDLAEGDYTVAASVADATGNEANANDTGNIDTTAPVLTVDAPDNSNDATPTITGTTDVPANLVVNLTVTGSDGAVQILSATVQASGTYSVDVPNDLAEGDYTVAATVADAAGNEANANDTGNIDTTAPVLTVDAPDISNDNTPIISGTTDTPLGTEVKIEVTDSNGATQSLIALVQVDGSFSVEIDTPLADGAFTLNVSVEDDAGNTTNVTASGEVNSALPNLSVNELPSGNDGTPIISGTTDAPVGSSVNITITDSNGVIQTLNTSVQVDGSYSVEVPVILEDGTYNVSVTVDDGLGNQAQVSATGTIDTTAPTLTVDAPENSNDVTPTITGTTDAPPNSVVELTVTGSDGTVQTLSATVQANGTYSVDVLNDLAEGDYTVAATVTDAAGNEANANDTGNIDTTAPIVTVDVPANSNDATPTITGTTDVPANSVVNLSVTGNDGAVQTLSATVQANGTYSVDVPNDLAEGDYTVAATVADAAGNEANANDTGNIDTTAPVLTVDAPDNSNDATPTITGTTNAPQNATVSILITDANGVVQTLSATVQANGTYSVNVPNALSEGDFTVEASITDAAGNDASANDSGNVDTLYPNLILDAPDNSADTTPIISGSTNAPEGSSVQITVTDSAGNVQVVDTLVLNDGSFTIEVSGVLAEGVFSVEANVSDQAGNQASITDTGSVDTVAPTLTVDAPYNSSDATPTIAGNTNAPVGSTVTITVTGSDTVVQTLTATVQPDGSFHVDVPSDLAEGAYTVDVTVADAAGNSTTESDTGSVDTVAPTLTVDAPDNSNDATPTITGITNAPQNTTVSILITDANGVEQTVSAAVLANGTYSVDVPSDLADGAYMAEASITDAAGNPATASDTGSVDTVAPTLTVDAPDNSDDATPTITGTTNAPENATVSITVTGSNNVVQTLSAPVQANGTYSVDVPSDLAEGVYTVEATITDTAGNSTTETDTGSVDTVAPTITVDAPDNSSDATPTIAGNTDAPVGSTVTITVTGSDTVVQTLTATVQHDGSFHVDVPSDLAEGAYTVDVTVADAAGNSTTQTDTGSVDTVAPTLTVDAPDNSNDATPTITGTTNAPENATVSILITDANGVEQTLSATVQANGTYSVDVPSDLADGAYMAEASITDTAGNSTTESDTGSVDTVAPTLTVDAPDNSNDATPTITGNTNEPVNSTVNITVTGSDNVVQTISATVQANGSYSVDVPSDLAEGAYTVEATITDTAGNSTTETDTGSVDTVAPTITVDAPDNSNDATPTIAGNTNAPVGSTVTITVTGSDTVVQTLTATVQPDGSFYVDVPSDLAEGAYTVDVTVADEAGNSTTQTDTGSVDTVAPTLTVDAPDNSNDATPTITGTTNAPVNSTVSILITGANGVEQTVSATVLANGTYSVDVPSDLAEGTYTVTAAISDSAGNEISVSQAGSVDTFPPTLIINAPDNTNDTTPTINGSTDANPGLNVSITVTDSNNISQTFNATVQPDGHFSADVPGVMADGNFTVSATVVDAATNSTTAVDSGSIDSTIPSLTLSLPANTNDDTPTLNGTTDASLDGSTVLITVTDSQGATQNLSTVVQSNGSFSIDVPGVLADGNYSVTATVDDGNGNVASATDSGNIDTIDPTLSLIIPSGADDTTPLISGSTNVAPGSTVTITVTDSQGAVQNLSATVLANGSYSVEVPVELGQGAYSVSATATDAAGNSTTQTDTGSVDTVAPTLTVDAPDNSNDATPTITGTTNAPENATVSILITDANGVEQTLSATVQANGTYSVDVPSDLADGAYMAEASITDTAGNSTTESDTGSVDTVAPTLTVDAPDNSNDATPTITGNTNEPVNSTVNITVTGSDNVVQTISATVQANGSYSVDVPSDLAEGAYTVEATITDTAGNSTTETDTGSVDTVAPTITVDAPDNSSDATPTIAGNTDAPVGSTVTITVTGSDTVVQTLTATVQPDGSFYVDVPSDLAEGAYTVDVTVADEAGNSTTQTDTGSVDTVAPTLTVDAPDNSNDATPTITGMTNAPENTTVNITVTGSNNVVQTLSATVQANGTYSVDVPSDLADGAYTAEASITDAAGNPATASDTGSVDTQAPTLTVDAPDNSDDATPTITGNTNAPENATVSITVTGSDNVVQTLSATVQANGTYSVDVPNDLAEGAYTAEATITDTAGNSTTESDTGSVDTVAPTLTVGAPDNSSDATPTIAGNTNAPVGSTVTITVTSSDTVVQNLTATVQPDGSFHVDVPSDLAEGAYTVDVTVADAAGNSTTQTDTGSVDTVAPTLTVDAPDNSSDATPTITGTTNAPENATVSILITGANGVEQTVSATVLANGTYSVDVPSDLADGAYTVDVTVADAAGNSTTETDTGSVDTVAPTLTVDAPDNSNDATPTITGTTNAPENATVSITVTGSNNVVQTLSAPVQANGTYSVDVPSDLAQGTYTVEATITDTAGNSTTETDTGSVDTVAPTITVDAPDNSNDATPTIAGNTNAPVGSTVTITVTGSDTVVQTLTATVQPDGSFHVDVPSALEEGAYTVEAAVADAAGNPASANDTGSVDTVAPTLTVDAPDNSNDATPTITGITNAPQNTTVSILIKDANGVEQTLSATVQANGTYSVDVPSDLADGAYTAEASITDAAGNSATASDNGSVDTADPIIDLTVVGEVESGFPIISGTCSEPQGTIVSVVVTDSNNVEFILSAQVDANGLFTVAIPVTVADGDATAVVSVTDLAGNETILNATIPIDLTAPVITLESLGSIDANANLPSITGTCSEPVGTIISVTLTDSAANEFNLTTTVGVGGLFTVLIPATIAEGDASAVVSITDIAGNETIVNATVPIDLTAPLVTLDKLGDIDLNLGLPVITGTCSEPQGTEVRVTLTDFVGDDHTLTATVGIGGLFTVAVPLTVAEGDASAVVSITDIAGNETIVNATVPIDLTAPLVTLDKLGDIDLNLGLPVITGSCSEPQGTEVRVTLTDFVGDEHVLTATVGVGGLFTVAIPVTVAEGDASAVVSITDIAGNETIVNATVPIDLTAPLITLDKLGDIDLNLGLPVITGTCSEPQGTEVRVTLTDFVGDEHVLTATVGIGGLFTVAIPVTVAEGDASAVVSITDIAGNETIVNATVPIDLTAPLVTLDKLGDIDVNLGLPVITGSCSEPQGTEVRVTLTDFVGDEHVLTATVGIGGLFTVAVPITVAEGDASAVVSITDIAGNETIVNATVPIDLTAPLVTLDKLGDIDLNLGLPVITGSCSEPQGTEVRVTLTDFVGDEHVLTATVGIGGLFTVAVPITVAEGDASAVVSITDIAGNETIVNATVPIDLTAPLVTLDKLGDIDLNLGLPVITGSCSEPQGTEVRVTLTDFVGDEHVLTATVGIGGLFTVAVPITVAEGDASAVVSITDIAGNETIVNATVPIDLTAPLVSLDKLGDIDLNLGLPVITGTCSEPQGTEVRVTLTDFVGIDHTLTATVGIGGLFTVVVPITVAEGDASAVVSITDIAGNETIVNATVPIDLTAPLVTLDKLGDIDLNLGLPVITGSCSEPQGTEVRVTLTDFVGDEHVLTATVGIGGLFTVAIPVTVAEGDASAVVSITDIAGNETIVNATVPIDLTAPLVTLDKLGDIDLNLGLPVITGTCSEPQGTEVRVTLTDFVGIDHTLTATVGIGGLFTVAVPITVAEGDASAVVSITDIAGNETIVNATVPIDLTAPLVTLDKLGEIDVNLGLPVITGTCNEPAGSLVSLTLTDEGGTDHILTSTVLDGGLISVAVPLALAQVIEGDIDIALSVTDAAGNQSTEASQGLIDITAPTLTFDDFSLFNVLAGTYTLTGSSSEPAGTIVSINISALGLVTIDTQAVVQAGGGFSVLVEIGLLPDLLNIEGSVTDISGNTTSAVNTYSLLDGLLAAPSAPSAKTAVDPVAEEETLNFALDDEDKINLSFAIEESNTEIGAQSTDNVSEVNDESAEVTLDIADLITDPADELFTTPEDAEVVSVMKNAESSAASEPATDTLSVSFADQELLKSLVQNNSLTVEA